MSPGLMSLEAPLLNRISQLMNDPAIQVLTAAQLVGVQEAGQYVPAVHVIYTGFEVRQTNGVVDIVENWWTVVAVRNVRNIRGGEDARQDAGPILDRLFMGLLGWRTDGIKPLLPSNPPRPVYKAGFAYFPLSWSARRDEFLAPMGVM